MEQGDRFCQQLRQLYRHDNSLKTFLGLIISKQSILTLDFLLHANHFIYHDNYGNKENKTCVYKMTPFKFLEQVHRLNFTEQQNINLFQ